MVKRSLIFMIISTALFLNACGLNEFNIPDEYSNRVGKGGYIHISMDDSNGIFEDLTNNEDKYDSIFEQPILNYVKELHDKYGIVISFYVFYSWNVNDGDFSLSQATNKFADEFTENSDWLKFGFHAKDASAYEELSAKEALDYYDKTIHELVRITGSRDCIDHFVRLDRYIADEETVLALQKTDEGINGLLIAEYQKEYRQSYALTYDEMKECYDKDVYLDTNNILYTPTDIRLENIESDNEFYEVLANVSNQPNIIIFTHEWQLQKENAQIIKNI